MPINIQENNTVKFVVQFLSTDTGEAVVPSSASVTVSYYVSGVATDTTFDLSLDGDFWTGTWDTTGADVNSVTWTTESSESSYARVSIIEVSTPAATGELRIVD